jgi:hypothetical protein
MAREVTELPLDGPASIFLQCSGRSCKGEGLFFVFLIIVGRAVKCSFGFTQLKR